MKISVLTPSFNSAKYIERSIMSVCKQDYAQWEHIIMDGASTDGTIEILKKHPHLIWESSPDLGQSDAMNKAFARSNGDIIFYLNADDEFDDGLFSYMIDEFKKFSDVDMIVGNLRINHSGKISIRTPSIDLAVILDHWPAKFPLNPVCYSYRRRLQEKVGQFPIHNHYAMDYWFLLRAYMKGNILKRERICGTYFIDGNNKSADSQRSKKELKIVKNAFVAAYFYHPQIFRFFFKLIISKIGKLKKQMSKKKKSLKSYIALEIKKYK